jgi:[ribosomal protein S18]-alanine N-acetyltransferase
VTYRIQPLTPASAAAIIIWRHPPPYDTYDFSGGELASLLAPQYRYHELLEGGHLVGYCCFGDDARVPGGAYADDALDVGWGMRPDLIGQGRGRGFVAAITRFAWQTYSPPRLRVTIADFNHRSRRAAETAGLTLERERFSSPSGMDFTVLVTEHRGQGRVIAPSEAEDTWAAYLASTPVV